MEKVVKGSSGKADEYGRSPRLGGFKGVDFGFLSQALCSCSLPGKGHSGKTESSALAPRQKVSGLSKNGVVRQDEVRCS